MFLRKLKVSKGKKPDRKVLARYTVPSTAIAEVDTDSKRLKVKRYNDPETCLQNIAEATQGDVLVQARVFDYGVLYLASIAARAASRDSKTVQEQRKLFAAAIETARFALKQNNVAITDEALHQMFYENPDFAELRAAEEAARTGAAMELDYTGRIADLLPNQDADEDDATGSESESESEEEDEEDEDES